MSSYYLPTEYADDVSSWVKTYLLTRPNSACPIDLYDLRNKPSKQLEEAKAPSETKPTTAQEASEKAMHSVNEPSLHSPQQTQPAEPLTQPHLPPDLATYEPRPLTQLELDFMALVTHAREHPLLEAEAGPAETDEEMARRLAEDEKNAQQKGQTRKSKAKQAKKTKRYQFQQPRPDLNIATGSSQAASLGNVSQQPDANAKTSQVDVSEASDRPG